jgi:uncharacterized FlgJ-related protein
MAIAKKQILLQRIEKRIRRIHKRIEKEKQNLINSGFDESEMFPLASSTEIS